MTFRTLNDGGLSVRIAGAEYVGRVHGVELESTNQGDGAASFWFEPGDPFNPQADFPDLRHGAKVVVEHTLGGVTTRLYTGFILSDPRAGSATATKTVSVECGGPLEVAKGRTDMGFVFTDPDAGQWFANKKSPKCFSMSNTGGISIGVAEGTKVPHDRAGMIGAVAYNGAVHLLGVLNGYKRITGTATWDLRDHMNAALLWWPAYKGSLDASDLPRDPPVDGEQPRQGPPFDYAINQAGKGAGYVALAMWSNKKGGTKTTDERGVDLDDVVLYTDLTEKTVDQAMLAVAQLVGLSPAGYDVAPIGSVLKGLVARPQHRPGLGAGDLRRPGGQDRRVGLPRRPLLRPSPRTRRRRDPGAAHLLPRRPRGRRRAVGRRAAPRDGAPALRAPALRAHRQDRLPARLAGLGHRAGQPRMGHRRPVHGHHRPGADGRLLGPQHDRGAGAQDRRQAGRASRPLRVERARGTALPDRAGLRRRQPAGPLHQGRRLDREPAGRRGPLYVVRSHVSVDTGYVDLDVGLSEDQLIDQLTAAGSTTAVPLHKPYRKKG